MSLVIDYCTVCHCEGSVCFQGTLIENKNCVCVCYIPVMSKLRQSNKTIMYISVFLITIKRSNEFQIPNIAKLLTNVVDHICVSMLMMQTAK